MAFKSVFVVLLSTLLTVNALATPHAFSNNHHRAIAARVAAPAPVPEIPSSFEVPVRRSRRSISRRCKARPAPSAPSSSSQAPATTSKAPATTSQAPATTAAPVNVAADPSTAVAQDTPKPSTHKSHTPDPSPTSSAAPAPSPSQDSGSNDSGSNSGSSNSGSNSGSDSGSSSNSGSNSGSSSGSSSSGNSGLSFLTGTQTGQGTFYSTGLGACGITNTDTDHIAAVSHLLFDQFPGYNGVNPNSNPVCGKKITATYKGKSTTITVTDRCEGCAITDLDFSPTAFSELADFALGRLSGMTWVWD